MMTTLLRRVSGLLAWLMDKPIPDDHTAASSAPESQPQPDSVSGETASEAAAPEEAPPSETPAKPSGDSACRAVIFSDRAYSTIVAETLNRHPDETGGVLLGQRKDGIWYVVEATDPGLKTQHSRHTHEMDDDYLNHVFRHLSRTYRKGLMLLGYWHRHPSSFDFFTGTDMETNAAYAEAIGDRTLSLLVNIDPAIRLTCYDCPLQPDGIVRPVPVPVLVGDHHFAGTDFLTPIYPDARIRPVTDRRPIYADKIA